MDSVKIETVVRNTVTGDEKVIEQTITLQETRGGPQLTYSVEGSDHIVRVEAVEYVGKLRELTGL